MGDGEQTLSLLYIEECVEGSMRLLPSRVATPVNIGSEEMVTINQLVDRAADIAGRIGKKHIPGPQGVRGRNSNNRLIREQLSWAPTQNLRAGLEVTYQWIEIQVMRNSRNFPVKTARWRPASRAVEMDQPAQHSWVLNAVVILVLLPVSLSKASGQPSLGNTDVNVSQTASTRVSDRDPASYSPAAGTAGNGEISVRHAGAIGDCSADDWWAFQKGIDTVAKRPGGGTLTVPPPQPGGCYRISQALRLKSLVTLRVLDDSTTIRCTGDPHRSWPEGTDPTGADIVHLGRWPTYSCVLFGAYESKSFTQLAPYAVVPVRAGDTNVTFSRSGAVADFVAGDLISIETVSGYSVTVQSVTYPVPTWRQVDLVTAVDARSNAITVQYPIQAPISPAQVLRLTNGASTSSWPTLNPVGGDTRIPLWATHGAAVLGGTWETANAKLPFSAGSGALDCRVKVHWITASRGVGYGNMMAGCHFQAEHEVIAGVVSELSEGSHDNTVEVNEVEASSANGTGPTVFPRYIGVNESARNNRVDMGILNVGATEGADAVQIWNATSNQFHVGRIEGNSLVGSIVSVAPQHLPGTPPSATHNAVQIDESTVAFARRGRIFINDAAVSNQIAVGGSTP